MRLVIIAIFALLVQGCGTVGPYGHWEPRKEFAGPLLMSGERAHAYWRCALIRNTSGGPCDVGFMDHRGQVISLRELEREIDAYVPSLSLPRDVRLYVLTISPTVVLAVPGRSRDRAPCSGEDYKTGCFVTTATGSIPFQYGPRAEVGDGAFWFLPSSGQRPVQVPQGARSVDIPLPNSVIRLSAEGPYWKVLRMKGEGDR